MELEGSPSHCGCERNFIVAVSNEVPVYTFSYQAKRSEPLLWPASCFLRNETEMLNLTNVYWKQKIPHFIDEWRSWLRHRHSLLRTIWLWTWKTCGLPTQSSRESSTNFLLCSWGVAHIAYSVSLALTPSKFRVALSAAWFQHYGSIMQCNDKISPLSWIH